MGEDFCFRRLSAFTKTINPRGFTNTTPLVLKPLLEGKFAPGEKIFFKRKNFAERLTTFRGYLFPGRGT